MKQKKTTCLTPQFYVNCLKQFVRLNDAGIDKAWYLLMTKSVSSEQHSKLYVFFLYIMLYKNTKKVNKTALRGVSKEDRRNIREKKNLLYFRDQEVGEEQLVKLFKSTEVKKELADFIENIYDDVTDVTDDVEELLDNMREDFEFFSQEFEKTA